MPVKKLLLFLLLLALMFATTLRLRYGGGEDYVDLTQPPLRDAADIEQVVSYREPIGNIAVNRDGRIFFTVHPEARPKGNKLLEHVDGASVPFPDAASQRLFDTVLGIAIDRQNRLWMIDHGNHGLRQPRLVGIDIDSREIIRNHPLPAEIAPTGSFLQDLQVSADGRTIVIADASFWRKMPALIVYDVETGEARRVLERAESVLADNYVITAENRRMVFAGGLLALRGGVDGIALDQDWLYFGALNGDTLYRIGIEDLGNAALPDSQLSARVEAYASKPLGDGMSIDRAGNVLLTDVEHNAVFRIGPDRKPLTLLRDPRLRWPDALSFGPDNMLYIADSALSEVIFMPQEHVDSEAPFGIYRIRLATGGHPGQ